MLGIIKKVNREGSGIIATAKGEKVPFVRSDVLNQQTPKPGAGEFWKAAASGLCGST